MHGRVNKWQALQQSLNLRLQTSWIPGPSAYYLIAFPIWVQPQAHARSVSKHIHIVNSDAVYLDPSESLVARVPIFALGWMLTNWYYDHHSAGRSKEPRDLASHSAWKEGTKHQAVHLAWLALSATSMLQ